MKKIFLVLICFSLLCPMHVKAGIVDEPLGARYSLGMTLWHMGHNPEMITRFHEWLKKSGQTPEKLLGPSRLKKPDSIIRVLVEPELLGEGKLNGWKINGDYITSWAGDAGPTVSIPVYIPKQGLYRFSILYYGRPNCRGVTFIKFYKSGKENLGPIFQQDALYDMPPDKEGPLWKDLLVDLP